jgi:putative transposase
MSYSRRRQLRTKYKSDITYAGGVYHITQRAPGKELLFVEEDDYLRMIALLKEAAETFDLDVFAFCCMPNHVHFLLRSRKDNLVTAMKFVFERYARYFNRKYNRKGHVFCGTFAAALCEQDDYFVTVSLYIHLNPCASGLAHDPCLYRWCSIRVYMENIEKTFIDRRYLLSMLDKNVNVARSIYHDMVYATRNVKISKFIFENKDSAEFKKKIIEALKRSERLQAVINKIFPSFMVNDEIRRAIAVKGRRVRSGEEREKRAYIIKQLQAEGYSLVDIATRLKLSRSMVYRTLKQI